MTTDDLEDNRKSKFPYLVDIGLGDYCNLAGKSCKIPCYTSSSSKGRMADKYYVSGPLCRALAEANVLEVVFGGGEPSHHPGLPEILCAYRNSDFKTGMTTRNYELHKLPLVDSIIRNLNSIAVSCNTVKDLEDSAEMIARVLEMLQAQREKNYDYGCYDDTSCSIYIQNILGLRPWKEMQAFLAKFKELYPWGTLTLLGYKNYGRGASKPPHPVPDNWIKELKNANVTLGVDSIIAKTYRKQLIASGVDASYLVGAEGKQTCYIDAGKVIVKPSSFTDESYPLPYPLTAEAFLEVYAKF